MKNNNKKGYLKIHVAVVNKTKKTLAIKVTDDEHVRDSKALPDLVNDVMKLDRKITIGKLITDVSYEGNNIFRCLSDNGVLACIK